MKKFLALFLVSIFLFSWAAADVDLSGMSFEDLVSLRDRLNLAIWNSQEWQEVEVPIGAWKVGEDIPAGHWTITLAYEGVGNVFYCDCVDDTGYSPGRGWHGYGETLSTRKNKDGSWASPNDPHIVDFEMVPGMYLINSSPVTITPYAGKPDLQFR